MEKQETEMKWKMENGKWKLEMEIGKVSTNKKCTDYWCNVFFIVFITLVFYLAMVIGLAL